MWSHVRARGPWLVRLGGLGLIFGLSAGLGPKSLRANSSQELEEALSRLAQVSVSHPRFEAQGGPFADFIWGRGLFFEGRELQEPDSLSDIYHARVSILPNGKLLAIRHVQNMTRTEHASETDLAVSEKHVFYATRATEDSFTILERATGAPSVEARLREYFRSGSINVYARTHVYPSKNASEIQVETDTQGQLHVSRNSSTDAYTLEREPWPSSPWPHLAADTARELFGIVPVAMLEEALFRVTGKLSRLRQTEPSRKPHHNAKLATPSDLTTGRRQFPPTNANLEWREERVAFWHDPGLAYIAEVTPTAGVFADKVLLTLFDMSKLELGIVGGYREPEPDSGPPDRGHIPDDPAQYSRIIATFNGGFQSAHGKFGMKVDGRVLVRPRTNLATVRVDPDGRVGIGTWASNDSTETPRAFRQNLEPLLAQGTFDPQGRGHFGDHLLSGGVMTERSSLCVTQEGHLIYAWGKAVDPEALADALRKASCVYAMHLDMNPGHCSLAYHRVKSFEPLSSESRLRTPEMRVNPERFLKWSPQDFFYLAKAHPDESSQVANGAVTEAVELEQVRAYAHTFRVEGATADGARSEAAPTRPSNSRVWGLGHKTNGSRPGLFLGGRWLVPGHRGFAGLEINERGELFLHATGSAKDPHPKSTWIGLPALIEDGKLTEGARAVGDFRARSALCEVTPGVFMFARAAGDSSLGIAETLLRRGCKLALSLDRGSHHAARRIDRATSSAVEFLDTDQSWLIVEPVESPPRAYVFRALSPGGASSPLQASH
jgi:hypothetical protein